MRPWPKPRPRAKRVKNPGEHNTRALVDQRSGGLCERCGKQGQSVHHRKNRSQGGRWSASNCVRLCGDGATGCHGWVGRRPHDAWVEGYHVKSWEEPASRPVLLSGEWRLLTDHGATFPTVAPEGGIA